MNKNQVPALKNCAVKGRRHHIINMLSWGCDQHIRAGRENMPMGCEDCVLAGLASQAACDESAGADWLGRWDRQKHSKPGVQPQQRTRVETRSWDSRLGLEQRPRLHGCTGGRVGLSTAPGPQAFCPKECDLQGQKEPVRASDQSCAHWLPWVAE